MSKLFKLGATFILFVPLFFNGYAFAQKNTEIGYITIVHGDKFVPNKKSQYIKLYHFDDGVEKSRINIAPEVIESLGGDNMLRGRALRISFEPEKSQERALGENSPPRVRKVLSVEAESINDQVRKSARSSSTSQQIAAGPHPYAQPWLNILVKFSDQTSLGYDHTLINSFFQDSFKGLEDYWKKASMGVIDVNGTTTRSNIIDLPNPRSYYVYDNGQGYGEIIDTNRIDEHINDIINQGQLSLSGYGGLNIFFERNSIGEYSWGTSSGFGLAAGVTYNNYINPYVIAHEMGHGFALGHTTSEDGLINSDQYDNYYDVMGSGYFLDQNTYLDWPTHINTYYKWKLNTLTSNNVIDSKGQDWSGGQQMYIRRHEDHQSTEAVVAIIRVPNTSSQYSGGKLYAVEVRGKVDYDLQLPNKSVQIYRVDSHQDDIEGWSSIPILLSQNSSSGGWGAGVEWKAGETYSIGAEGITIDILSEDSDGFIINIEAPQSEPFTPSAPSASYLPYTDRISVSWSSVSGASSYKVYRCTTTSTSSCGTEFTDTASPFDDTGTVTGTTYYYRIKACNAAGCSDYSGYDAGTSGIAAPNASDSTYPDKVQVTWMAVSNADSYKVYRCITTSASSCGTEFTDTASPYDDTGAVAGTTYYYRLKACNADGCSNYSDLDAGTRAITIPAIASEPNASDNDTTKIRITWETVDGATWHYLFGCIDNDISSCVQLPSSPVQSPYDIQAGVHGIQIGHEFFFRIKACNSAGCSELGASDSGIIPLEIPLGVIASDSTYTDKIRISWSSVNGASSYKIYRCTTTSASSCGTEFTDISSPYEDTSAVAGVTYYYRVKACVAENCSDYSDYDAGIRAILDQDEDGIPDAIDNCPSLSNPSQEDNDKDDIGDVCDFDDDNDLTPDTADCAALDNTKWQLFGGYIDTDADDIGVGTFKSICSGASYPEGYTNNATGDNCPNNANTDQLNTDSDDLGDVCDIDQDNDGVLNGGDIDPLNPMICEDSDFDQCDDCSVGQDGFGELADNDPANDGLDSDSNGQCNESDPDDDGDGIDDDEDNCPLVSNVDQSDSDGSGVGDACQAKEGDELCFPIRTNKAVAIICL